MEPRSCKDGPDRVCRGPPGRRMRPALNGELDRDFEKRRKLRLWAGQSVVKGSTFVLETWFHVTRLASNSPHFVAKSDL